MKYNWKQMKCVSPSGSGPAASDPEDGLAGFDDAARRHPGSVHRAEPDGHHHPDGAHPEHGPASPGARSTRLNDSFSTRQHVCKTHNDPVAVCLPADADEQQHSDHRPRDDGRRRQAAHQAAAAGLRPHSPGRGAVPDDGRWRQRRLRSGHGHGGAGRRGEGGREEDDPQHHREAVPLLHQRQDRGAQGPRHGQRRQGSATWRSRKVAFFATRFPRCPHLFTLSFISSFCRCTSQEC